MSSRSEHTRVSRRIVALLLGALYVLGVVYGTFVLVLKPSAPPQLPLPAVRPALAQHVLFVVVDGLRYDVATDPRRMPRFAQAMQRHQSADIFAGRISMTSAAVQNYGTGQRGRFAQIVRNINPDPPPYASWLANAAERGLVLALAGDPTWAQMFGKSFRYKELDPPGVAIDHDFNDQTFAQTRELLAKAPHFLVAHFVTPDHQGHVHGIPSERYAQHIFGFDRRLFELLAELPPSWTVIVSSDHGAADSGTHGADVMVQRRSPIFAYGPGIAGKSSAQTLDQSDMASTFAALLGVPAPVHSQGHILSAWLGVSPELQASYGCDDAARLVRLLSTTAPSHASDFERRLTASCEAARPPPARRLAAEQLAREIDATLSGLQDFSSWQAWTFLAATLVGAAWVGWLLVGEHLGTALVCALLGLIAIALVAGLERLPGYWPKSLDGVLFVVFNLPSLLFLLRPEALIRMLSKRALFAAAVVPGGFAVAYPTNLQPVAFAICLAAPLVIGLGSAPERWGVSLADRDGPPWFGRLLLLVVWGIALSPAGIMPSGAYSGLARQPNLTLALALGLLAILAWAVSYGSPPRARMLGLMLALAAFSLLLRRVAPPWLGRPLLLALPICGVLLLWRRQVRAGLWLLLAGYLWVSRDFEVLPVTAGLGILWLLGQRWQHVTLELWTRGRWLITIGVIFCVMFLVRLGMSAGLDALSLDFRAGAFGDKDVSASWVTFAVIWKYVLVIAALLVAALHGLPRSVAERSVVALVALGVCRAAVLLGMMQCSQGSYWTTMRVMSDLPFALLFAVAAALILPWTTRLPEPEPAS